MRIDQWEVLRHLTAGPLSVSELSERLSRSPSSVTRSLETFKGQGLATFSAEHNHAAPNRPKGRWALTKKGLSLAKKAPMAAQAPSAPAGAPDDRAGLLEAHQGFVTANVENDRVPALLEVLASGEQAIEASFVARLDGDGHDYLFIFDPRLGARATESLAAALSAADFSFRTGVVADVRSIDQLVADARSARGSARRAMGRGRGARGEG